VSAREEAATVKLHAVIDMVVAREFVIPPHIRLAVFDLDGTLVTHSYPHWCREAVRIYPSLGAGRVTLARVRRDFGCGKLFAALPPGDRDSLISRFWDMYDHQNAPRPRCLPGIRSALTRMKRHGLTIGIATARLEPQTSLMPRIARWKLERLVDFVLTCIAPGGEPHSSKVPVLLQLLRLAGVSARDAMMVGDSPSDIECARSAGYAVQVAVCTGGIEPATLAAANPTAVVNVAAALSCGTRAAGQTAPSLR
jgi:phosphoglycolate phosphatase